jgi:exonuclease III
VSIHIVTFNVCGLPTAYRPVADRAPGFCRELERHDLDVVNLQEVWTRSALKVIRANLPSLPYVAWRRGIGGQPAGGLATFSRHPIGRVSYTSFRRALPPSGGLRFRVRRTINTFLQGVLVVDLPGAGVTLANTHLTANKDGDWSAGNRHFPFQAAQLRRLHAAVPASDRPTVLTGDFNVAACGPLYPDVVDNGRWHDPFAPDGPITFHREFLPPGSTGHRIDYLLCSPSTYPVVETGLLFTRPEPDYLSDHVALRARLG